MIHEIRVSNFYSIRDEVVLDLRVPENAPSLSKFRPSHSRPSVRLPTVVVLLGPNAAGKSTVLRAITSTVSFACRSFELDVDAAIPGFQAFMHKDYIGKPIKFSADFDAFWLTKEPEGPAQLFRYELEICRSNTEQLSPKEVRYEGLFHYPRGRPRRLLERKAGQEQIYVSKEFEITPNDTRLKSVRPNSSVISTLAKFNNSLAMAIWTDLMRLQSNLFGLKRSNLQTEAVIAHYAKYPLVLERLNRELRRFDVGISRMELEQLPTGGLIARFYHDGLAGPILMDEESSGTRHFVHMFPQLEFILSTGGVAIFDEFDADLHPDLVKELFSWFESPARNPHGAQLLVTAHNSAVLEHLEKENVFLVEKDNNGATRLYGARDVKGLRRETSLFNKYTGGALGALPRIG